VLLRQKQESGFAEVKTAGDLQAGGKVADNFFSICK